MRSLSLVPGAMRRCKARSGVRLMILAFGVRVPVEVGTVRPDTVEASLDNPDAPVEVDPPSEEVDEPAREGTDDVVVRPYASL
jgi:hypothetical protein